MPCPPVPREAAWAPRAASIQGVGAPRRADAKGMRVWCLANRHLDPVVAVARPSGARRASAVVKTTRRDEFGRRRGRHAGALTWHCDGGRTIQIPAPPAKKRVNRPGIRRTPRIELPSTEGLRLQAGLKAPQLSVTRDRNLAVPGATSRPLCMCRNSWAPPGRPRGRLYPPAALPPQGRSMATRTSWCRCST